MNLPEPIGKQAEVAYLTASGHQVVLGTAGTGKTVMAVHRAIHLADPVTKNSGQTLLVTYNNSLVAYLKYLSATHRNQLSIETAGRFARGYLLSRGKMSSNAIADKGAPARFAERAVNLVAETYKPDRFFQRPTKFFLAEFQWIDGNGVPSLDRYLEVDRVGRRQALGPAARKAVWKIYCTYKNLIREGGWSYDWNDIWTTVRSELTLDTRPRLYRHIVIDEGQDFSPQTIRALTEAVQADGSITFFADYAQQLYGHRIPWTSVGLRVRRPEIFADNLRNTTQIANLAIELAGMDHFKDALDLVAPVAPSAAGPKPLLANFGSEDEEAATVAARAAELGRTQRVAVLCTNRADANRATITIPGRRPLHDNLGRWDPTAGVYHGTLYSAKGLEFDSVLMPFCSASKIPRSVEVEAAGEREANASEARLLYVGITRAKSELIVTYSGELTPLLPPQTSDVWNTV